MRFSCAIAALLVSCTLSAFAQKRVPLHDGQRVTLRGTLTMRPAGRLQFVALKTSEIYVPFTFGEDRKGHPEQPVQEIGLSGYYSYDLLYLHRGQPVTVSGKLMTDGASPYYLNNTSLAVSSIRLSNGTELKGIQRPKPRLAVDMGEYQAQVVLPANLALPWQYSAQGSPDLEQRFLSCSSNGGGDVVNCSCADGFQALRAGSTTKGVSAQVFNDSHTAQFGLGDNAHRVDLSVTCSR